MLWARTIALMDMNAFFASVEQRDNSALRNQPIAITNGRHGSCIITASYEARAFGIKTGMRFADAKRLCPALIRCPSQPERYISTSRNIMQALHTITPDIEVFSIDEAFLDLSHCQHLYNTPESVGKLIKSTVWQASRLLCSVGISGDKTTAKFAAKCQKPDGLTIIPPDKAKARLYNEPVTALCGINTGIASFLAKYGVYFCGDMEKLPISVLAKRFGNVGRRLWYMCQGADPEPIKMQARAPKSLGHGKILPPGTKDKYTILIYLYHMAEKLGARLRRYELASSIFTIGLRTRHRGWLQGKRQLPVPSDDGRIIYQQAKQFALFEINTQEEILQVQITALRPEPSQQQGDLFLTNHHASNPINQTIDAINQRFGEFCIMPAPLLKRSDAPNVISPSFTQSSDWTQGL